MHENQVYCEAMEPGGESRFTTEAADLSEEMEEGLLSHVFRLGDVAEHAKAEGVDAAFMKSVELGECFGISGFG
jgi:hypothetical protein